MAHPAGPDWDDSDWGDLDWGDLDWDSAVL